ncbi:MAG TPA: response regulator transcription factor [Candidatus Binatia bacterium]|jgi:DNA-binding NarL/FixJ family response regulator
MSIRVFIVDDSPIVRDRLVDMLSELEAVEVVGQSENAAEATQRIRELRPDAVVLDIRLASGNGIDVLRTIKKERPGVLVIMLTLYPDPQYRESCMKAGASFFLDKFTGFEKIPEALKTCRSGRETVKRIFR